MEVTVQEQLFIEDNEFLFEEQEETEEETVTVIDLGEELNVIEDIS